MSPKLVLHIDDDDDDLELMKDAIQSIDGFLLKQCSSGKEGLRFLEQAKTFGDLPCLIILDMNMPEMDGMYLVKKIKADEVLSKVPVIVFTTSNGLADHEFCKKHSVPMFVKPYALKDFNGVVQNILKHGNDDISAYRQPSSTS